VEEMLIARVHVYVQVMSIRGAQFKYAGHVVSFLRDVGTVYLVGAAPCTRTQFPLSVAFAVTVHKCQGMTASRIVANISKRDFQAGITYVAVSCATSLRGVMFDVPFDLEAIRQASRDSFVQREDDTRRRMP